MTKHTVRKVLTDIRFWIVVFFALRLIGITNPPLEVGHNWRQSLTNMIARNFLEGNANLLYPTIDMAGNKTGIIGSEFPFYNYLIYLVSLLFDYTHWAGRLINLLVSSIGLYYFYLLLRDLIDQRTAFHGTIILTVSVWFAFARKIMPDTFSVALVIIGLYQAYHYLRTGLLWRLVLFFVFSTLGMLCKIPALSLFSVLAVVPLVRNIEVSRKIKLLSVSALGFGIVCSWYFYWVPHLLSTYDYQLYFPKGLIEGMKEIAPLLPELLKRFYFSALHSYLGFLCFMVGLVLLVKSNRTYLKAGIVLITAVFALFILKTGSVFPLHNYYIIPFVPVMALVAGYATARLPSKLPYIVLALISIEGMANQQHGFRIKATEMYKLELAGITEKVLPTDDLIVINGGSSPQLMYFAHRKGWSIDPAEASNPKTLDSLVRLGARYLVLDRSRNDQVSSAGRLLYQDEHFLVYRLAENEN